MPNEGESVRETGEIFKDRHIDHEWDFSGRQQQRSYGFHNAMLKAIASVTRRLGLLPSNETTQRHASKLKDNASINDNTKRP